MSTPATPALSHGDAARLWMSSRDNPMVVTAVLPLDGPLDLATLRALLGERLAARDRFRARIDLPRVPWNRPHWREDPAFSIDRHVARIALPPGSTEADLARAVSELASLPMPLDHPPWRAWIVDGAEPASVLVVRVHHAIADGMALLGVLFSVSDEGAGSLPPPEAPTPPRPRASLPPAADLLRGAATLGHLLVQRADASGLLAGRPGPRKRVAWSRPVALEPVRLAAHAAGAHVNDVILAALAGALRRALGARRALLTGSVHALVPVALARAPGDLGNQFASVFVELPLHVDAPVGRLSLVRESALRARESAGLSLGRTLVDLLGTLGGIAHHAGVRLLSRKASLVASNVPGPPVPLHLGGRAITALRFAAPSPGSIALSANVASYAGELSLTLLADERLGVSPDDLARFFVAELDALVSLLAPVGAPT
jgi:diacylglycerol O-acyltransferase